MLMQGLEAAGRLVLGVEVHLGRLQLGGHLRGPGPVSRGGSLSQVVVDSVKLVERGEPSGPHVIVLVVGLIGCGLSCSDWRPDHSATRPGKNVEAAE